MSAQPHRPSRLSPASLAVMLSLMVEVLAIGIPCRAQCASSWQPGQGLPGTLHEPQYIDNIQAVLVLPGGDLIAGGVFQAIGATYASGIARYSASSGRWSSLAPGALFVHSLALLPDGDVIVGGEFAVAGSFDVARYRPSTGEWSGLGSGVHHLHSYRTTSISAAAGLSDGRIVVAGSFDTAGSTPADNIAVYNPSTGAWSSMGLGIPGADARVNRMIALPGGGLLVGGSFDNAGGGGIARIARYLPSAGGVGRWVPAGVSVARQDGSAASVVDMAVLPGGDVLVVGYFDTAGGIPARGVARYNPATDSWSAAQVPDRVSEGNIVRLASAPGGDLFALGYFPAPSGEPIASIARYNPATDSWSFFGSPLSGSNSAYSLAVLPDGDAVVGGSFSDIGGVSATNIARYHPASDSWSALTSGTNGPPLAFAPLASGDVIVGGQFRSIGGVEAAGIARYAPATGVWSAIGSGVSTSPAYGAYVNALAVAPGGDVILGGFFTQAGGIAAESLARYSPATNGWSSLGSGISSGDMYYPAEVDGLAVLPGGDVVACGRFATAAVAPADGLARFSPSTNTWTSIPTPINAASADEHITHALAVLPGGDLLAATRLTYYPVKKGVDEVSDTIQRYSWADHAWHYLFVGAASADALQPLPGGDILLGGIQFSPDGYRYGSLARYNPGLNSWTLLNSEVNPHIRSLALMPGGDVLVGGTFPAIGGVVANNVARYHMAANTWSALGPGTRGIDTIDGSVLAAAALPNGDLLIGGNFLSAGDHFSAYFARFSQGPVCPADFNCSGTVSPQDIFDFLSAYFARDPRADVNHSGGVSIQDIFDFVAAYFAGCP